MTFAQRLTLALTRRYPGQTQHRIAQQLGVSDALVSQWLAGKKLPSIKKMVDLATALEVSIDWLATGRSGYLYIGDLEPDQQRYLRLCAEALRDNTGDQQ